MDARVLAYLLGFVLFACCPLACALATVATHLPVTP